MDRGDTQELFGTGCVPDLRSHTLVTVRERHGPELELHSVGRLRLLLEESFCDSEHEVGLAHGLIANDNDFVEVIETLLRVVKCSTILVGHFLFQGEEPRGQREPAATESSEGVAIELGEPVPAEQCQGNRW